MKRQFLFLTLFVFLLGKVFSQGFEGGLLVGPTATQVTGDMLSGYNKLGAMAGVFTQFVFDDRNSLRMEMYYIQKGARRVPSEYDPRKFLISLHYVEVPFIYQYRFYHKFSAQFGLSFAYLFKAYEKDLYGLVDPHGRKPFRNFDFSGQIGLNYQLSEKFHLGGRFSYSALFIREKPDFESVAFHNMRQFNDVLQLSVSYSF